MSRDGLKYVRPNRVLPQSDNGGAAEDPTTGTILRGFVDISQSDGYSVGCPAVRCREGDLIILYHATGTTGTTGLGAPNNPPGGGVWQQMRIWDGSVLNHAAAGANGAVRLRAWYKWATFADT